MTKMVECNQRNLYIYDKFATFIFSSAFILKQKLSSATKKIGVSLSNLAFLYYVQLHIFWKYVHAFY